MLQDLTRTGARLLSRGALGEAALGRSKRLRNRKTSRPILWRDPRIASSVLLGAPESAPGLAIPADLGSGVDFLAYEPIAELARCLAWGNEASNSLRF